MPGVMARRIEAAANAVGPVWSTNVGEEFPVQFGPVEAFHRPRRKAERASGEDQVAGLGVGALDPDPAPPLAVLLKRFPDIRQEG
jgi:hypothetical protein